MDNGGKNLQKIKKKIFNMNYFLFPSSLTLSYILEREK